MRESFVIHSEYIEDLPEELKTEFLTHAYNYGIKETLPTFNADMVGTLKQSLWMKIQRRIDADIFTYEEQKRKKQEYKKKWEESRKIRNHSESFEEIPPYTDTNTHSVNVSVPVSVSDNVSVSEFESVSVFDNVSVSDAPEHLGNNALSPILSNEDYPKAVYKLWKDAGLPCGDFTQWTMRDFKTALEYIHKNRYSSQEVIAACENYIKELNDPDSYITNQMPFASFVKSKIFYNVLPTNYRHENFVKFVTKPEEKPYTGEMLKGVMYG